MQINACLVGETDPKSCFLGWQLLSKIQLRIIPGILFLKKKNNVNYDIPTSCKISLLQSTNQSPWTGIRHLNHWWVAEILDVTDALLQTGCLNWFCVTISVPPAASKLILEVLYLCFATSWLGTVWWRFVEKPHQAPAQSSCWSCTSSCLSPGSGGSIFRSCILCSGERCLWALLPVPCIARRCRICSCLQCGRVTPWQPLGLLFHKNKVILRPPLKFVSKVVPVPAH